MVHNLKILNVNASRISRRDRIVGLMALLNSIGSNIICIQEINIREAYTVDNTFYFDYDTNIFIYNK